ncbi:ribbon-helix-helix protein, CopG family, partial [Dokdonella soli]|uniref:Ribbon-helix-helix protein CopG domain-containing protein n=1 Tax=Dokdonella soli TaxID=529810 RepID=A0ABP3UB59_9GAMM
MSTVNDETKADRLTLRLPSHDLERLRELARRRQMDVAALGREAIRALLDGADPQVGHDRLTTTLREAIREQADRVIARHEQTTRALIAALNQHKEGSP